MTEATRENLFETVNVINELNYLPIGLDIDKYENCYLWIEGTDKTLQKCHSISECYVVLSTMYEYLKNMRYVDNMTEYVKYMANKTE